MMYRATWVAALGGIVSVLVMAPAGSAEEAGKAAAAPEASTPPAQAAPARAPQAPQQTQAGGSAPAASEPAASAQGQASAPAGAPSAASGPAQNPCAGGMSPWAAGAGRGPYAYGPWGPWGGPWSRPMPPRPPFPQWSESMAREEVTVETDADDKNYYVIVHLAGLDPDKVQVQVRHRGLVVSSGLGWERRVTGPGAWEAQTEHRYFHEFLSLPWDADTSRMSRKVEDDTLRIVIPRRGS